jgi:hypothetical protein
MHRMLTLKALVFSLALAACAAEVDDPPPAPVEGEGKLNQLRPVELPPAYPSERLPEFLAEPRACMPSMPDCSIDQKSVAARERAELHEAAQWQSMDDQLITWDELLICIRCAADRLEARIATTPRAP